MAFAHVLNVFVSTIFCIFGYFFLLNLTNYVFTFLFSCINLWGVIPDLIQGVGKGKGGASPMWTLQRNVDPNGRNDEWGNNEWKGGNICG